MASALTCLGQAYAGLGQPDLARPALDEAHALLERWGFALHLSGQLDDPSQEPVVGTGVGPPADEQVDVTV